MFSKSPVLNTPLTSTDEGYISPSVVKNDSGFSPCNGKESEMVRRKETGGNPCKFPCFIYRWDLITAKCLWFSIQFTIHLDILSHPKSSRVSPLLLLISKWKMFVFKMKPSTFKRAKAPRRKEEGQTPHSHVEKNNPKQTNLGRKTDTQLLGSHICFCWWLPWSRTGLPVRVQRESTAPFC